ncbi:DUF427 domain-containing protein [Georgenia sp. 10Sc9-8]|uniref:DUF427 domain-containing protein n=1 Tax=Georgenia halotolerans TaxID=3028317 RepID=A0ABT5TZC4_9MICO|nr:DUF427 domain-containing protein [Georgenia halotolerans]
MGLTFAHAPLAAGRPSEVNYRIEGPEPLLFLGEFPRRVRARLGGRTVVDTRRGRLLHETGMLPVLYVPEDDLALDLLQPTTHTTHCPFKGRAAYWSVHLGGRVAENAVWAYPEPIAAASWLRGLRAVCWDAMDAWYDEDEQVHGHLRDPYHRVDVRPVGELVRVTVDCRVLAESTRAQVLSETGLPNRYYLPRADVRVELGASGTSSVCPYKGHASYWSAAGLDDVAWSYENPLDDAARVAGDLCFAHAEVSVEVG